MDKDVEDDSEELEDAEGTEDVIQEGTGTLFDNLEDDNAAPQGEETENSDSEE